MGRIALTLIIASLILVGCATVSNGNQNVSRGEAIKKICEQNSFDVEISQCNDYYSSYPSGWDSAEKRREGQKTGERLMVTDAPTSIYDNNGSFIMACGGFTAEEASKKQEKECSKYPLNNCTTILESCFDLQ